MLDPIIGLFQWVFERIGRAIGWVVAAMLWPFITLAAWVRKRGIFIKAFFSAIVIAIVLSYGYLFYQTQFWRGFDRDYASLYQFETRKTRPGSPVEGKEGTCGPSAIVQIAGDLTDFNVNRNGWNPSSLFYKLGLAGLPWKNTPWFDNKASFQLGVNEIVRRTALEAVDRLGRVRGTSQIDQDLQNARQNIYYNEDFWYFSFDPIGPKSPTPSSYRAAISNFEKFNSRLEKCDALFDPRADNLLRFLDQMSNTMGSTSDILGDRIRASNAGWFDPRADDRFWFTYGQVYALNGVMAAAQSDFADVIAERGLTKTWAEMQSQLRSTLDIDPIIISNGAESGFIMPSHLAIMGFYLLRVRANMTEMRDILDR